MSDNVLCPECGRALEYVSVMLAGNYLIGKAPEPVARYDCSECNVIVGVDCDQEWGWAQWEAQGNKRNE